MDTKQDVQDKMLPQLILEVEWVLIKCRKYEERIIGIEERACAMYKNRIVEHLRYISLVGLTCCIQEGCSRSKWSIERDEMGEI